MAEAMINGVKLYYEVSGADFPLILCHEFAGDCRSWRPQVEFFRQYYQVIIYNTRGYPPSDVPDDLSLYAQELAVEDVRGLLEHLGISLAHICGFSMGGSVALNFALTYPSMARSLVVAGVGTGSASPENFRTRVKEFAQRLETDGMASMADYPRGPQRVQLLRKAPERWQQFADHFLEQSSAGLARTLRGVLGRRPSIFDLETQLHTLDVSTLILVGDEDDPCVEPSLFLKRSIPRSGLAVFPQSGHTLNLEEPDRFNRTVLEFLKAVEAGKWAERDRGVQSAVLAT